MSPPAPFQVASLINPPSYPNAVVWSDDNLIAVATGDIVTILNPESPQAPRGVITLTPGKPLPIGVIDRADLLSGCLLPTCLSRDRQPCVRSLSWSPVGFASNNGCLLAVCSTDGLVKVYRQPYCEFQAEWVEIMDISDMMHVYYAKINYGELEFSSLAPFDVSASQILTENSAADDERNFISTKERKRKRMDAVNTVVESVVFPSSLMQEGSPVEVFNKDGRQHIWIAGRLQRLEESTALVQLCDMDANGEQQWFEMDSTVNTSDEVNNPGVLTADGDYSFPRIRPSMDVARLPDQILSVKHKIGELLKAGQIVEAWTRDRWLEGLFVGFSDEDMLVKFSGIAEAVALSPIHVRLPPLWIAEDKSWQVTVVRVQMQELPEMVADKADNAKVNNRTAKIKLNSTKKTLNNHTINLITARQYALRSSMLASLVVAWSPVLQLSATAPGTCDCFCLLAVGTKSGTISIWRVHRPAYYSVERQDDPTAMILVSVLHAHGSWVTALSWGLLASDSSPQVLLASGCSDGSTKTWLAHVCDFERSSETNHTPFSLFSEVTTSVDNALVSALSLCVPVQSPQKILLAVGKVSGIFEVWTCNRKNKGSKRVGSCDAHVQAVTGLAWAFDGRWLYSCSQDNSMHGWRHHKGSLSQELIPPNNLGTRSSSDLPSVSDSCYGIAVSPGNLALVVARRFDAGQLDNMYQKRTQRAAVEFFWIGGQQVDISPSIDIELDIDPSSVFSKAELACWGSKLLWSLNIYECHDKHLVLWDVIAALLAFKQCAPQFIKHIVIRWLQQLLLKGHGDPSTKDILSDLPIHISNISSRQLHLFNIICRRVIVSSGFKVVKVPAKPVKLAGSYDMEEEQKWVDLMSDSEKELRERLVGLSLSTVLVRNSLSVPEGDSTLWNPVGIAQMVKWELVNHDDLHHQLNFLAPDVSILTAGLPSGGAYTAEEHCCYCSAIVPFESPEMAVCEGVKCSDEEASQKHKLVRCAVSMQVCPLTPLWFCMCCQRRASKLPPRQLFSMLDYPSDVILFTKSLVTNLLPYPLCPFCGISLQRLQPDFLLSISPV